MKTSTIISIKIFILVILLLVGSSGVAMSQQTTGGEIVLPKFEIVYERVGDKLCYSECSLLLISNATTSTALTKINRHNHEQLFEEHASKKTIDVRSALERKRLKDFENELKIDPEELWGPIWSKFEQEAKVVRGGKVLSINTLSMYYLGGSHEIYSPTICNYNLETGECYDLSYIEQGEWLPRLQKKIFKKLPDASQGHVDSPDEIYIPSSIEITEKGVRFHFKPYEVASYADGIIEVELSDKELSSLGIPTPWK